MKKLLLTFLFTLIASNAFSQGIQLFNPNVLGSKTENQVTLLNKQKNNDLQPIGIKLDTKDGSYIAATVIYPEELNFAEAKANLNRVYKTYEVEKTHENPTIGLWRNEEEKFAIHLTASNEGNIQVIYLKFTDTK